MGEDHVPAAGVTGSGNLTHSGQGHSGVTVCRLDGRWVVSVAAGGSLSRRRRWTRPSLGVRMGLQGSSSSRQSDALPRRSQRELTAAREAQGEGRLRRLTAFKVNFNISHISTREFQMKLALGFVFPSGS